MLDSFRFPIRRFQPAVSPLCDLHSHRDAHIYLRIDESRLTDGAIKSPVLRAILVGSGTELMRPSASATQPYSLAFRPALNGSRFSTDRLLIVLLIVRTVQIEHDVECSILGAVGIHVQGKACSRVNHSGEAAVTDRGTS